MDSKSVLFITYNGVLEPIMQSQGIPYLKGLAKKGYRICILSFEKKDKKNTDFNSRVSAMRQQLKDENMEWRMLRYHKRPSLLATGFDMMCGIAYAFLLALKTKAGIIHCRATIPAVMGLPAAKVLKRKFLYDMRGINAHEYVDGDLWPAGGMNFRIMDFAERRLACLSDAIVVLTKKFADFIEKSDYLAEKKKLNLHMIPCCVDLDRFFVSAGKNENLQYILLTDNSLRLKKRAAELDIIRKHYKQISVFKPNPVFTRFFPLFTVEDFRRLDRVSLFSNAGLATGPRIDILLRKEK